MKNYVLLLLIPKEEIIKIHNHVIIKKSYKYQHRIQAIFSHQKNSSIILIDYIAIFLFYILFKITMQKRNMLIQ